MSHITAFEMKKWLNNYPEALSGGNRIMNDLRGILTKAVAAGYLDKTPMSELKRLKEDKSKKIKYLTREYGLLMLAPYGSESVRFESIKLPQIHHCFFIKMTDKAINKESPFRDVNNRKLPGIISSDSQSRW